MEALTLDQAPSVGSDMTSEARLITNTFGDGYEQTAPDGLNAVKRTWPCQWTSLSHGDADYLEAFFIRNVGKPFTYAAPGQVPLRWTCKSWKRGYPAGGYSSFSATLTQRFDNG